MILIKNSKFFSSLLFFEKGLDMLVMILFMEKKAFQTMKISFSYSKKICIFRKELTYDFGQKFEISF